MFSSNTLLCLLAIALTIVDASPVSRRDSKATLRFATTVNKRGMLKIAELDRARAQHMRNSNQPGKRDGSVDISNQAVHYTAEVKVGSPPTAYNLLIDTGSSNTFVGAGQAYVKTSTSHDTGNTVSVSYGTGSWSGEEWTDTVTLSPDLVIKQQSIGVATSFTGFDGVDGILGVGPVDLTDGTVTNTGTVPTVVDNLFAQGTISQEVLGVYFKPKSDSSSGELTFGGYDHDVAFDVTYVPITETSPASTYWGIDQTVTYGDQTVLALTAGIVDTGTTLILLATDAFDKYQSLTGAAMDKDTGLLKITPEQYDNLQSLMFWIGDMPYELIPNGQIWPRSLNTQIGGTTDGIYLIVSDAGAKSGSGLDFLNGLTFLERFYSIYDGSNNRVGIGMTPHTLSTSN